MELSSQQKRILKRHAGDLIPNPTPLWTEIGDDTRNEIFQRLLERLRATQNTGIADIIEASPDLGWTGIQEKVRSMRYVQRKRNTETGVQNENADSLNHSV